MATISTCAKCSQQVNADRTYCTKYSHNKWETVQRCKDRFLQMKDPYGVELCDMFLKNTKPNPLQPTSGVRNRPAGCDKESLSDFMKIYTERYLKVLIAMMESLVDGSKGKKGQDLEERADRVVNELLKGNFKKLRLMDGHGRMVASICKKLLDLEEYDFLDNLEIELVDINSQVHQYHKSTFVHKNFRTICQDIFSLDHDPDTFVYLNFCGMGKYLDSVKKFASKATTTFMISYSCARKASGKNYIHSFSSLVDCVPISENRKDFKTYVCKVACGLNTSKPLQKLDHSIPGQKLDGPIFAAQIKRDPLAVSKWK